MENLLVLGSEVQFRLLHCTINIVITIMVYLFIYRNYVQHKELKPKDEKGLKSIKRLIVVSLILVAANIAYTVTLLLYYVNL